MTTLRAAAALLLTFGPTIAGPAYAFRPEPPRADEKVKADDVEADPPFGDFLVVPLRVHVLTATDLPEVDCKLTDDDVARVLKKANGIWHRAGIHLGLESLVREPAAGQDKFRLARDLEKSRSLGQYRVLLPAGSRKLDGLHVYYIHEFAVNGVYMGSDYALVKETARLRPVEGGIDEPLPRVTAHELGHALGLTHRQDRTNLLASGTTGTRLNTAEVETARLRARKTKGVLDVSALKDAAGAAEAAGDAASATRLWTWVGEIPGGERESGEALDRLKAGSGKKGAVQGGGE